MNTLLKAEDVAPKIYWIRGYRVMLDRDLASLYGVKPIALRQQVKRNINRFPTDFMFHLTENETSLLVSQNVIADIRSLGGSRPMAFTQEGVSMLSGVLRSPVAVQVNIAIMRAFVRVKLVLSGHQDLLVRLEKIEQRLMKHGRKLRGHHSEIRQIFAAIQALLEPPVPGHRRAIGFRGK